MTQEAIKNDLKKTKYKVKTKYIYIWIYIFILLNKPHEYLRKLLKKLYKNCYINMLVNYVNQNHQPKHSLRMKYYTNVKKAK